mgnify:CR=1 FL=1
MVTHEYKGNVQKGNLGQSEGEHEGERKGNIIK